jgi:hypothetical protein
MQSEQVLIAAWMQENGGARRFESGVSSGFYFAFDYLKTRGIQLQMQQGRYYLSRDGRKWTLLKRGELQKLLDSERAAEGLPPLRRAAS